MTKQIPDISIVVSSWNASDIIEEALDSIVATAGDLAVDVTVIDDASTDGGVGHIAEKFKHDARFSFVVNTVNVGQSALNIMLARSKTKYLLTLDTDARLKPGALQALFNFMESHPEAGAASGNLLNPDGSLQRYYRRILTPSLYFFTTPIGRVFDKYLFGLHYYKKYRYDDLDLTRTVELEQPPIACLIIRRAALAPDPYIFDPQFKLFMLDVDFPKRLYGRGYKVYFVAEAKVIHLKTASASKRGKKWLDAELHRSFILYFRKHHPYLAPLMWLVHLSDKWLRALLQSVVGREPMR